ncbi:hypothetical protein SLEP1_g53857 [Rubroshorea leprosula]|uniref:Uncharacterized protein n=1 Tax=Rubroshorea leprosula TaxID=152421 RepID=A0AAV5MAK5_9ROSI|nr:hypothetical protein SLEP1_g53857 [Rubroshorea leprosula]
MWKLGIFLGIIPSHVHVGLSTRSHLDLLFQEGAKNQFGCFYESSQGS